MRSRAVGGTWGGGLPRGTERAQGPGYAQASCRRRDGLLEQGVNREGHFPVTPLHDHWPRKVVPHSCVQNRRHIT